MLLGIVAVIIFLPLPATAAEYHVDKAGDNLVQFTPRTPLQDFEVTTSSIDGYVTWAGEAYPPENLDGSEIYFEVQLNTLDAGNSMYNRHLKENYLETDKFPYASYKGTIDSVGQAGDKARPIYTSGVFNIHGQDHKIAIVGIISGTDGDLLIKCDFIILLSSHDIEVPKLMFMETDERINVILKFNLKAIK